jgi:hypothetical protein
MYMDFRIVLSWKAITEALAEEDYDPKIGNDDGATGSQFVSEPFMFIVHERTTDTVLSFIDEHRPRYGPSTCEHFVSFHGGSSISFHQVSILLLSLQMIADRILIDSSVLLKLKAHLVQIVGFGDISVTSSPSGHSFHIRFGEVSEIPELSLPCVHGLLPVLDAYHTVDLPHFSMVGANEQDERPLSLLVGSVFVDVALAIFCTVRQLLTLPVLTSKAILETLCVIIYKHDFESQALRHLQQTLRRAVLRALDIMSQDINYELRQLALSVVQAFIKRWHSFMGSVV